MSLTTVPETTSVAPLAKSAVVPICGFGNHTTGGTTGVVVFDGTTGLVGFVGSVVFSEVVAFVGSVIFSVVFSDVPG